MGEEDKTAHALILLVKKAFKNTNANNYDPDDALTPVSYGSFFFRSGTNNSNNSRVVVIIIIVG